MPGLDFEPWETPLAGEQFLHGAVLDLALLGEKLLKGFDKGVRVAQRFGDGLLFWWSGEGQAKRPDLTEVQPLSIASSLEAINLSLTRVREQEVVKELRVQLRPIRAYDANVLIDVASLDASVGDCAAPDGCTSDVKEDIIGFDLGVRKSGVCVIVDEG
jgi:hypothetical protein